jgi:hypothetical protein
MAKQKEQKIEFKVTYCTSNQLQLMLGMKRYTKKTVYFYLSDFLKYFKESIVLLYDEKDKPVRKYYLGLKYDGHFGKAKFIENIKKIILKTYEPVVEIYLESYFISLYSKDLLSILTHENLDEPFFFVPIKDRNSVGFTNAMLNPSKYFTNNFFKKNSDNTKSHMSA